MSKGRRKLYRNKGTGKECFIIGNKGTELQVKYVDSKGAYWYTKRDFTRIFERIKN